MSTQSKAFLTPEQYLEIERAAEVKSEYFNGEMFAMSGARRKHNLIQTNILSELRQQLRGRQCETYPSDMRVRVSATGLYTYPDVVVVCGEPIFLDDREDTLLNPTLLVEVLSPSTEKYDRGQKLEHYQTIESLRHYLLVASDRVRADLFTLPTGWTGTGNLEDMIALEAIGCRLKLADIYEKVKLEPVPLRAQNV